jgi:hypothetical protein
MPQSDATEHYTIQRKQKLRLERGVSHHLKPANFQAWEHQKQKLAKSAATANIAI